MKLRRPAEKSKIGAIPIHQDEKHQASTQLSFYTDAEREIVSPKSISPPLAMVKSLKSILKALRIWSSNGSPPERLKPISWWNSIYWIRYTLSTDYKHYLPKQRPLSFSRLLNNLQPNLKAPIFVIGAPRSGTTFLGACLAELPELSYHFEPVLTKAAARYVYEGLWSPKQATRFYKTVYSWLMRIHLDGDLRFAEKTPQLCFIVPFLSKAFPDAKFIHIVRDGRDAALSLSQKPWHQNKKRNSTIRDPDGYLCGPWARFWVELNRIEEFENTNDIHRCSWIWRQHVKEVLKSANHIAQKQYYELKYENLILDPISESKKLLDFLEISNPSSRKLFLETVSGRVSSSSIGRWNAQLSDSEIQQIDAEIGILLDDLGYFK